MLVSVCTKLVALNMTVICALSVTALIIKTLSTATSIIWSLLSQIRGLKVKACSLVQVCFVSLKNPLDSAMDLLPVWRTGLTGSESGTQRGRWKTFTNRYLGRCVRLSSGLTEQKTDRKIAATASS